MLLSLCGSFRCYQSIHILTKITFDQNTEEMHPSRKPTDAYMAAFLSLQAGEEAGAWLMTCGPLCRAGKVSGGHRSDLSMVGVLAFLSLQKPEGREFLGGLRATGPGKELQASGHSNN